MRVTLRDYLHSLNVINKDVDIFVDGHDLAIAICPPIKLTPEGEAEFGGLLDNKDIYVNSDIDVVMSDNENDYKPDGNLWKVSKFVIYLAGYCPTYKFNKWFEGDDAELV